MAVKDLNKRIGELSSGKSRWEEKAKERIANKSWLKHSRKIALKINVFLKENKLKQKELAEMLDVSPQQISKILKGKENLTLETISRIESVLNIQLLEFINSTKTEINLQKDYTYTKPKSEKKNYQVNKGKVLKVDFKKEREDFSNYRKKA